MVSVTSVCAFVPAVATARNVRGDPEVLAKGRHGEKERSRPSKEGRRGSIEYEPFREREQNTAEKNWVVLAGARRWRSKTTEVPAVVAAQSLTPSSGASMTRPVPPGKFPSTNQAQLQCPATRYRHSGLLGSSIRSAHANAGDKDQPERPVTSGPTPIHLGPAAAALKLPRNEQGPAPSCKCNSSVLCFVEGRSTTRDTLHPSTPMHCFICAKRA